MRTWLKHDILNIIETLLQAHIEIKNNVKAQKYDSAQFLLNQCQESAISIGTTIEEFEGTDFITVSYIEEYCECLYRVYEELYDHTSHATLIYNQLNVRLLKIENSIRYDIDEKKEVIFLPYKASMWDSLESVWRAADEDPECDAYVIPIPYYDKNPDGSLKNEHYEGDEFPADVPIIHYDHYDFKNRHPDAIFIHNPYDQYNYVTTVHPFFYTNKLKEYGGKLIYIPYYVSAEADPDNYTLMEDRAGYVLSNGVLHSDMVFVQSENTKKLFVNILEKNVSGVGRTYWEKKIYGLGSPKFDRVNSTQRDDAQLSEQWKSIIYTSNSVRKQTIFYNVSVSTLLNHTEILEKIEDTLAYFRSHTDLALWWRPHPLYESTLSSMRPELLIKYKKIVNKYKEEAWGIFDEGVDLNWAIAETDAYYGDNSSVVHLFKKAQKPVMIQNVRVMAMKKNLTEDIPIWPSAFYVEGDDIWFVHGKINVLMRYNLKEDNTYVVAQIPNETFFCESAYQAVFKWANKIILIPSWAREFAVYDVSNSVFQKISLANIEKYYQKILFCKAYIFDKYLYCIPYQYEAIIKINLESMDIQYIDIRKILELQADDTISTPFIHDATLIGNKIAAVIYDTNKLLFLDVKTDKLSIYSGRNGQKFTRINSINKKLFIYDKTEHGIVVWDTCLSNKEETFIPVELENIVLNDLGIRYIVIDSYSEPGYIILNEKGNPISHYNTDLFINKNDLDYSYFEGIENNQFFLDGAYYFSTYENKLFHFVNGFLSQKYTFSITHKEVRKLKKISANQSIEEIAENELYNIHNWIEFVKKTNVLKYKEYKNCGKQILNVVKGLI